MSTLESLKSFRQHPPMAWAMPVSGARTGYILTPEQMDDVIAQLENVSPKPAAVVESAERILIALIANKTSSQVSVDKKFLIALAKDLATELHKD